MTDITYISWDPGGSAKPSTGMTTWSEDGKAIGSVKLTQKEFLDTLVRLKPIASNIRAFIIEAFTGRPGSGYGGNTFKTSRQIGALELYCVEFDIQKVLQQPGCKDMGLAYSGHKKTWRGKHMPDDKSSYYHGYYYLHHQKIIRPAVLDDKRFKK